MRALLLLGLRDFRTALAVGIGLVVIGLGSLVYSFFDSKPNDAIGWVGAFIVCVLLSIRYSYRAYHLHKNNRQPIN